MKIIIYILPDTDIYAIKIVKIRVFVLYMHYTRLDVYLWKQEALLWQRDRATRCQ